MLGWGWEKTQAQVTVQKHMCMAELPLAIWRRREVSDFKHDPLAKMPPISFFFFLYKRKYMRTKQDNKDTYQKDGLFFIVAREREIYGGPGPQYNVSFIFFDVGYF